MNIERINTYRDPRFSQAVLNQHGAFLFQGEPYEIEITSACEAVIRGKDPAVYSALIPEFRFYAPHITAFFDSAGNLIQAFPPVAILTIPLQCIQPSQFYADEEKVRAVSTFLTSKEDIIIQVQRDGDRYISLDGHTRLYYAVKQGWSDIRAVEESADPYIFEFSAEAQKRSIYSPYDLVALPHKEYVQKWGKFCDDFFRRKEHK